MRIALTTALIATLAACSTPSEKISDTLVTYGIAPPQAVCVGDRLQRNLSLSQLSELARLARNYREANPGGGRPSLDDLLRISQDMRDPQVPIEVTRAAAGCGVISSLLGLPG